MKDILQQLTISVVNNIHNENNNKNMGKIDMNCKHDEIPILKPITYF